MPYREKPIALSLVQLVYKPPGEPRLFVVVEEEGVVVVIQHIVQASPLYVAFELSLSVPQIVAGS